jgi:hypothetical protein
MLCATLIGYYEHLEPYVFQLPIHMTYGVPLVTVGAALLAQSGGALAMFSTAHRCVNAPLYSLPLIVPGAICVILERVRGVQDCERRMKVDSVIPTCHL